MREVACLHLMHAHCTAPAAFVASKPDAGKHSAQASLTEPMIHLKGHKRLFQDAHQY